MSAALQTDFSGKPAIVLDKVNSGTAPCTCCATCR